MIFWWLVHRVANELAWRFARPGKPANLTALATSRRRLWRLNRWAADHYVPAYVAWLIRKDRGEEC